MYLGIDFLLAPDLRIFTVDVNLGLPGGAEEYDRTHRVRFGVSSNIFDRIEEISEQVYGLPFRDYLRSLPFLDDLKQLKLWLDGGDSLPEKIHPALRLEDKWNQAGLLRGRVPIPETALPDPQRPEAGEALLETWGKAVLKRRAGRGGKGLLTITDPGFLRKRDIEFHRYLLQEYVESKVGDRTLSIRSVAFGGRFLCMYANLSVHPVSNHGIIFPVLPGRSLGLETPNVRTVRFDSKSWEAEIWFGENTPSYLRHNLYEDEVSDTALILPDWAVQEIIRRSVRIERLVESLDWKNLPKACFEESGDA